MASDKAVDFIIELYEEEKETVTKLLQSNIQYQHRISELEKQLLNAKELNGSTKGE